MSSPALRRMTDQQLLPLQQLGVKITPEILDQDRWEAFWDAPLRVPGTEAAHHGSTPPADGIADQPGLPRKPAEIHRAAASYDIQSCAVRTNGGRLEISYPGVHLGAFSPGLCSTPSIQAARTPIRQEIIAAIEEAAVAYKYDAGVKGMQIAAGSRIAWRDAANLWQDYQFGGAVNRSPVTVQASNRILVIQGERAWLNLRRFRPYTISSGRGEIDYNLGYNWYRKRQRRPRFPSVSAA